MIYYLPVVIVFVLVCITAINLHSLYMLLVIGFYSKSCIFLHVLFKVQTLASWFFRLISSIFL
jgi:hypothetical protein